jgi:hypothetical protein
MTNSKTLVRSGTKRREAACHRCGWTQSLSKVSRNTQIQLGSAQKYGWLCDDCVADLTGSRELVPSSSTAATHEVPSHAARTRSVA